MNNTSTQLSRTEFIATTGVFVTHSYWSEIEEEFQSSGLSPIAFCSQWYDNYNNGEILEIESTGKIKVCIHDDDISHMTWVDGKEDFDELTIVDLINNLSQTSNDYYVRLQAMIQEFVSMKADIDKVNSQITIINSMIEPENIKIKKLLS